MDVAPNTPEPHASVRPAKPEDYDRIAELWRAAGLRVSTEGRESAAAFRAQLAHFPDTYLVATMDPANRIAGAIIGVVLGSHDHRKGWINRLAVHPDHRRKGVAAALVSACDAAIRAHGIRIVSMLIDVGNPASLALFEKLGYVADVPVHYLRKRSAPEA